jgi:hypothetical protein
MKLKPFLIEIAIITALVLLARLLIILFGNAPLDINRHDTYVVSSGFIIGLPTLLLIFIVYIIKEGFFRYGRRLQNVILLIVIFVINIELSKYIEAVATLSKTINGFNRLTIYPPLSALPTHPPIVAAPSPSPFGNMAQALFFLQIFFLVLMVIIAVLTGKNWNHNKNASQ